MNPEEIAEWQDILRRCDEGGNDGADVYEAEEFCRHIERKYGKPFNELDGSNMNARMNEQTHRLTDFPGERHPHICQQCGNSNIPGKGKGILRLTLDRWQECDHNDKPENKIIVLCNVCSKRMIEPHPRLYHRLSPNDPWPGCMEICLDCRWREGITCKHPNAKANGGPGVMLSVKPPIRGFIDGAKNRGRFEQYPEPPSACRQKEINA